MFFVDEAHAEEKHRRDSYGERHQRGGAVGHVEKPSDHGEECRDEDEFLLSLGSFRATPRYEEVPNEERSQEQKVASEQVLVGGDASIDGLACPLRKPASKLRIVLDQHERVRDED